MKSPFDESAPDHLAPAGDLATSESGVGKWHPAQAALVIMSADRPGRPLRRRGTGIGGRSDG
jgi:hypothetical protein